MFKNKLVKIRQSQNLYTSRFDVEMGVESLTKLRRGVQGTHWQLHK